MGKEPLPGTGVEATGAQGAMPELVTRGQLIGEQGKPTVESGALKLEELGRCV